MDLFARGEGDDASLPCFVSAMIMVLRAYTYENIEFFRRIFARNFPITL